MVLNHIARLARVAWHTQEQRARRSGEFLDEPDICGGCKVVFRCQELDAVLLDEEGAEASDVGYCRVCFPKFQVVSYDRHRRM